MATNMPDALDEALLRPGRIDRIYKVGYPSKAGRVRTYRGYFDKVDHELTEEQLDKLATITPYATGATIKDLVNESLITAIRDGRETITWSDVTRAKRLKQLGPPEDVEYIERERHAVAVHEACHAVAAYRTRYHLEIDIATIEKGADYLGMVASIKPEDQFTRWKSEHEADIMVSLASLAGERMFFDEDNSSGVSGDLFSATYLTALMEAHWGMGRGVTSVPALQELDIVGGKSMPKPGGTGGVGFTRTPGGGQALAPDVLGERIEYNLVRLLEATETLLGEHRREVLCLAHALETHKTLNGDDVVAVLEHRPGPLVDGSAYASDEFYAEIEEYHLEAARAHREHSRVERELPAPVVPPRLEPAAALVQGVVVTGNGHGSALPAAVGPVAAAEPDFVPWGDDGQALRPPSSPEAPSPGPSPAGPLPAGPSPAGPSPSGLSPSGVPARKRGPRLRTVAVVAASLAALAVFTGLGAYALSGEANVVVAENGTLQTGALQPGALVVVLGAVVTVVLVAGIAFAVIRGNQATRASAEAQRDRAVERAQLLAAAMDPKVAMRILGYNGADDPTSR
ncbi:hypothetical protein [Streptosporangium sp. NPDC000396]|uniref:hypothetical protein n=1 Tax=Streptosporangium sp. NPDC000396 TaxID=3366185 RepID=UPI0036A39F25